jgi:hypothetical protein
MCRAAFDVFELFDVYTQVQRLAGDVSNVPRRGPVVPHCLPLREHILYRAHAIEDTFYAAVQTRLAVSHSVSQLKP